MGWLERLHVEDCAAGFDKHWAVKKAGIAAGFRGITDPAAGPAQILLQGLGPKLLRPLASSFCCVEGWSCEAPRQWNLDSSQRACRCGAAGFQSWSRSFMGLGLAARSRQKLEY
jgi:hypothetical protein